MFFPVDMVHGLREAQRANGHTGEQPLWDYSRTTAWRRIEEVMTDKRVLTMQNVLRVTSRRI